MAFILPENKSTFDAENAPWVSPKTGMRMKVAGLRHALARGLGDAALLDPATGGVALCVKKLRASDEWPVVGESMVLRNEHAPYGPFYGRNPREMAMLAESLERRNALGVFSDRESAARALNLLVPAAEPNPEIVLTTTSVFTTDGSWDKEQREILSHLFKPYADGRENGGWGSKVTAVVVANVQGGEAGDARGFWSQMARLYPIDDLLTLSRFQTTVRDFSGLELEPAASAAAAAEDEVLDEDDGADLLTEEEAEEEPSESAEDRLKSLALSEFGVFIHHVKPAPPPGEWAERFVIAIDYERGRGGPYGIVEYRRIRDEWVLDSRMFLAEKREIAAEIESRGESASGFLRQVR